MSSLDLSQIHGSERVLRLLEASKFASEETLQLLLNPSLSNELLGPLIPDPSKRLELLTHTYDSCISTLQSEFKYAIEENNIPEQLQRLEVTLNEWDEAKLNLLMSNKTPHFNHLNEAPNPYKVEVEKNSQYLRRLNHMIEEYKSKIVAQREAISNLLENIHQKSADIDSKLDKTISLQSTLFQSKYKIWADSQTNDSQ